MRGRLLGSAACVLATPDHINEIHEVYREMFKGPACSGTACDEKARTETDESLFKRFVATSMKAPDLQQLVNGTGDPFIRLMNEETFKRTNGFYFLRKARYGIFATFPYDLFVSASLFVHGIWSEAQVRFFQRFMPPGGVAVDVGANIGAFTVPLAQIAGPAGTVIAFEPFRRLFQVLCTNVVLNGYTNVVTHQVALGAKQEQKALPTYIYDAVGNHGSSSIQVSNWLQMDRSKAEVIEIRPLDSYNLGKIHLLKIDVEHVELDVIEGARATIERCRPIIVIETDKPAVIKAIMQLKYRCSVAKNEPYVYGTERNDDIRFIPDEYDNVVCFPDEYPEDPTQPQPGQEKPLAGRVEMPPDTPKASEEL